MTEITCPQCQSDMMPWRHSSTWRAYTCWRCWFVKIERVDAQAADPAGVPVCETEGELPGRRAD